MTREELASIISGGKYYDSSDLKVADRILAALEKEKAGEVVVCEGLMKWHKDQTEIVSKRESTCGGDTWVSCDFREVDGKTGQLIFRPTTGKGDGI